MDGLKEGIGDPIKFRTNKGGIGGILYTIERGGKGITVNEQTLKILEQEHMRMGK